MHSQNRPTIVIEPVKGWQFIDFQELKEYRDLFYFLVLRDIRVIYAQTILGFGWAILQPLVQIILFTIIFGKVAKLPTDGIPYALFSTVAIIPWSYMSGAMTQGCQSLVAGQAVLGKVYFPRIIYPLVPIFSKLVDFSISAVILVGALLYYQVSPTWNLLFLPLLVILMMGIPAGVSLWLSALAVRFRDIKFALPFFLQMLIYSAPILYTASILPDSYRWLYSLNPIVGVVEGYRACFLGTPLPWDSILPSIVFTAMLFLSGVFYFKRVEPVFVDVV